MNIFDTRDFKKLDKEDQKVALDMMLELLRMQFAKVQEKDNKKKENKNG